MQNEQTLYKQAVQSYQSGNLPETERFVRQILSTNPEHAPSLHIMGLIGLDVERYEMAEEFVNAAIAFQSDNPSFHFTLGRILSRQDKKEDAIESYKTALAIKPDFKDALNNLGTILLSLERLDEASEIFTRILIDNPRDFNALSNTASILYQKKQYEESIAHYRAALKIDSTRPNVYYDIGVALLDQSKTEEALSFFLKAIEHKPDYVDALLKIGNIYRHTGDAEQALSYYSKIKSIELNEYAFVGTAFIYIEQGRHQEAMMEVEYAHKHLPESFRLNNFLGTVYNRANMYNKALEFYDHAIEIDSNQADVYANKATTLKNLGRLKEAVESLKKALSVSQEAWIYSNILLTMLYADFVSPEELAQTARDFGDRLANPLLRNRPFTNDRSLDRKLRIGYISPDFCHHPVSYFLSPIYKHDPNNFELFAYSKVEAEDSTTEKLKSHFDHWRDVKFKSNEETADLIEQDKIDILIDPAGHTGRNGLMAMAYKPAPIQITWLGYTATTGMKAMDYRITDVYAEPQGMTEYLNTETLWRLPDIFAAYVPHENSPLAIDHPPFEDNGYITFGCFNNFTKVTDEVLKLWTKIMEQVPDAKLMLEIAGINDQNIRDKVEERIINFGISKDRFILVPHAHANQYVLYNKIDIALDPFPAVGGTTSMDTLWMGVPFVTLAGKHFASRMGVSILTNVGLPELIAQNADEYVSIAVNLAKDKDKLRNMRHGLREKTAASPLMDQEKFARNMEKAYREMWHKWVQSQQ